MYDSADMISVFLLGVILGFTALFGVLIYLGRKAGR